MNLHQKTKKLASETELTAAIICRDLNFDKSWYSRWKRGQIPDPGVERIQKLHDYLVTDIKRLSASVDR